MYGLFQKNVYMANSQTSITLHEMSNGNHSAMKRLCGYHMAVWQNLAIVEQV